MTRRAKRYKPESPTGETTGSGEGADVLAPGRENTKLLERAVAHVWPIPKEVLPAIVNRQVRVAIDPASSNREASIAAKCVLAMNNQNLEAHKEAAALVNNQILIANYSNSGNDDESVPQVVITMPDNGRD